MRKSSSTNARNEAALVAGCPVAAAMKIIGGRWKLMLLWYIHRGVARYGQLRTTIPHISQKMLYTQLRELERDGLILRLSDGRAVRYRLSELGRALLPALEAMEAWSRDHHLSERLARATS